MEVIVVPESKINLNKTSFAKIYDSNIDKIYKFIYYKTYHKETAEDLTSQTFLKALEKFHQYNPEKGSISSWLYQIARNLVTDYYRLKRNTVDIDDVWDLQDDQNIELDMENKEQLEELREVLKKLPADQRDILILRVWLDLTYNDIAQVLGKTEGACKMMFSRLISRLRKELSVAALLLFFLMKL